MALREMQVRFVFNKSLLIRWAFANGYELTDGDAYRDPLLAKLNSGLYGLIERATKKIEWLARRGAEESLHCQRLAQDFNLFKDGEYISDTDSHRSLGKFWESLHEQNRWGGRYGDGNHYEMVPYKWRDKDYEPL